MQPCWRQRTGFWPVLKRAKNSEDLAKEFSRDPKRSKERRLGNAEALGFQRKDFSDVAFNLKAGEVSAPVLLPEGCLPALCRGPQVRRHPANRRSARPDRGDPQPADDGDEPGALARAPAPERLHQALLIAGRHGSRRGALAAPPIEGSLALKYGPGQAYATPKARRHRQQVPPRRIAAETRLGFRGVRLDHGADVVSEPHRREIRL